MYRALLIATILLLATSAAWGQSPPQADLVEQVKTLLERVDKLEKRVTELEAKQTAPPVAPVPTPTANAPTAAQAEAQPAGVKPEPAQTMEGHNMEAQAAAVGQLETHYPSLQFRGFGDVDFSSTDQKGSNSGFNLGQLTLHLASPLSQKVSYFGEMTFNAHPSGYTVEVERSIIRYDYDDYFKISFGRYHTPIGYWNTAYHHGAWLQTTIDRPEFVKFGGTFIPIHFVGLLAEGRIPSGDAGLFYNFGVGNGRGDEINRPGDAGDNNNNRAWVANIFMRPAKLYGLQIGGSFYKDKISGDIANNHLGFGNDFREWIASGHIVWTRGAPEFLAEFANVNHRSILTNKTANSDAYYVQFGYRMPGLEKTLKPYYRFEYMHTPKSEQVFADLDLVESIAGLRYDISSYAAFKAEYRHANRNVLVTPTFNGIVNGLFLQTCFTF